VFNNPNDIIEFVVEALVLWVFLGVLSFIVYLHVRYNSDGLDRIRADFNELKSKLESTIKRFIQ
jgi:hypothetical protein